MLNTILSYYTYFGGFLAVLLGVQQVIGNKHGWANILRFTHMLCNCLILIGIGFIANGVALQYPVTILPFILCVFLLGPSYWFSINTMLGNKAVLIKSDWLHLLPVFTMLLIEIAALIQNNGNIDGFIQQALYLPLLSPVALIMVLAVIHIETYEIMIIKDVILFWNKPGIKVEVRIISLRAIFAMISALVFCAGYILADQTVMLLGGTIIASIMVGVFISQEYYPEFFFALKNEIRKKRYERSLLTGLNTTLIKNRIEELMADEQLYKNANLSLQTLAAKLSLTSHQLSQFLNDQMKVNFRNYVNGYRVSEAKRLLRANAGMGISTVCYEAGFNSKTTFNVVFKEMTGKTPREFRDEIAAEIATPSRVLR